MDNVPATLLIDTVVQLLTEAYIGPPDASATWFIDNEPDSGILGVISSLSADEASMSVDDRGQEGSTIASNVEHLRWSLAQFNAAIAGGAFEGKWKESWNLVNADRDAWDRLRGALRSEFETLCMALKKQDRLPEEYITGLIAAVPHAAFHLGILRQMIERVRAAR